MPPFGNKTDNSVGSPSKKRLIRNDSMGGGGDHDHHAPGDSNIDSLTYVADESDVWRVRILLRRTFLMSRLFRECYFWWLVGIIQTDGHLVSRIPTITIVKIPHPQKI
jgi:hypothetical protein